jgi:hypothetical protein
MSDHQEWLTSIAHYFETKGKKAGVLFCSLVIDQIYRQSWLINSI